MNRFDKFALAIAAAATLLCARETMNSGIFYVEAYSLTRAASAIGILGWILASYGPIALAALPWRWSKRCRLDWVLHLLFLPGAILIFWAGNFLMLHVIGAPDFDASIGGPVILGILLLLAAVGGYLFAAIVHASTSRKRPAPPDPAALEDIFS